MAKSPKPVVKAKEPELKGQPKPAEPMAEEFNWRGFLVPNAEKLLLFLVVIIVTAAVYALFVTTRGVGMDSVSVVLIDYKTLLLVLASYFWVCYAVERKLGIVRSLLPVLLPELVIVIYILMKIPKFTAPA